ncbi:MAG: hypothetical protein R6U28_13410 [Cyclonatronaceae bacterium]
MQNTLFLTQRMLSVVCCLYIAVSKSAVHLFECAAVFIASANNLQKVKKLQVVPGTGFFLLPACLRMGTDQLADECKLLDGNPLHLSFQSPKKTAVLFNPVLQQSICIKATTLPGAGQHLYCASRGFNPPRLRLMSANS